MISLHQVDFGEELLPLEFGREVLQRADRISIVCCHGVESAVVAADSPTPAWFGRDEEGTAPFRFAAVCYPEVDELLELRFGDGEFLGVQTTGA